MSSPPPQRASGAAAVALVLPGAGAAAPRTYACFARIERRDGGGLFLEGAWLLELAEEAELAIEIDGATLRARIRVIELARGSRPGMVVAVLGDAALRERVAAAIG
jgi:hypothetical protein